MDSQLATILTSRRSPLTRFWPWLAVLVVLLFVGFIRIRLLEMPLERDEGEYAYAGQLILQGVPPCKLAYSMKLPGTGLACAIGMAVFGQTTAGIHGTLIVANSLTIIFVFLLGRKLFGVMAGLVACASYGVMSVSPLVYGLAAHANHFVVLCALPATLLLWNANESGRTRNLFFSGLLYGLAFLMKQQGICFGIFGWGVLLFWEMQKKPVVWFDFAGRILAFGLGMILPFGLTCFYLARAGVFPKFWFWTFTYARFYVTSRPLSSGEFFLRHHLQETFATSLGFWVLASMGLLFALYDKIIQKEAIFVMFFWLCSFLGTATGLYFQPNYFILLLPAFAILIGLAARSLQRVFRSRLTRIIPLILALAILGWNIFVLQSFFFRLRPEQVAQIIYYGNPFIETVAAGKYIREHAAENARMAVIGSEPEIYFYAQRRSATGFLYTYPLMENQPYAAAMQQQMIGEIESARPDYLVLVTSRDSWLAGNYSDLEIFGWVRKYTAEHYNCVGVLSCPLGAQSTEVWGDAAKSYINPLNQPVIVYQSKPPPD